MCEPWLPIAERIVFATLNRGHRTIAVTAAQTGSGVSTLCETLARVTALSGKRTLLIDMTGPATDAVCASAWKPGAGKGTGAVRECPGGFARLEIKFTRDDRFVFSNVALTRQALAEDFVQFDAIFVDLPPVPQVDPERINGSAAASACDGALVVCMSGRLPRATAAACRGELENAQAKVLGIVVNERNAPTLGAELAREARRLRRFAPAVSSWLERKALASVFLN